MRTGEVVAKTVQHEGENVREFYAALPGPVRVGIEATGSMHWFLNLMEELRIDCQVGHPAKTRTAETRKQKHDRRDAALLLKLLAEDRFPSIWMPSIEQRDLRALLLHRHLSSGCCIDRLSWRGSSDKCPDNSRLSSRASCPAL